MTVFMSGELRSPTWGVRQTLARSDLAAGGGFLVCRLAPAAEIAALRREAVACHRHATACRVPRPPAGPEARGQPDRWLDVAIGDAVLRSFFHAPAVLGQLAALTGMACRPHGVLGTYSYYRAPGHYLGVHRDAVGCDLAVITCLGDTVTDDEGGGQLVVYPGGATRSLAAVRAEPGRGAHRLRLRPGESAVLLGSLVPHRVTPVGPGQIRIVAPLCYDLAAVPAAPPDAIRAGVVAQDWSTVT